ncbi:diadenylate cyclase CdaA [Phaeocystidibacter marisrubri]|uniref:Diadenylate cyclase n=1 Tax=Phaeocystidibacter marisrubri TaxID=1577780 RepID=A0A6L3ZKR9_9FLAO|nr:diadenylate cyclase CdaA [Phaeocystidibacter marisrubri]KAB2818138.1 TIGR00159 family protein [Phaeocystidibacter marisrubri]GGH71757.1 membrane protein [Phaeocystidibacter marisrubri]
MTAAEFALNALEILIFAGVLFSLYRLVRGTPAIYIFGGVVAIYITWKIAAVLHMELLSEILEQFINVGFIALIIVFQQEVRKFLLMIGSNSFGRRRRFLRQLLWLKREEQEVDVDPIVHAMSQMIETKTGALIAIERKMPLGYYAQTGVALNAKVGSRLLQSIFFKDAPLHDGAVIIAQDKIMSASAILPVSESDEIPARYGLRHRAAVGLSEKTDAVCLVASEETGQIAIVLDGEISVIKDKEELRRRLTELLKY